jgi:hypothetical protein
VARPSIVAFSLFLLLTSGLVVLRRPGYYGLGLGLGLGIWTDGRDGPALSSDGRRHESIVSRLDDATRIYYYYDGWA